MNSVRRASAATKTATRTSAIRITNAAPTTTVSPTIEYNSLLDDDETGQVVFNADGTSRIVDEESDADYILARINESQKDQNDTKQPALSSPQTPQTPRFTSLNFLTRLVNARPVSVSFSTASDSPSATSADPSDEIDWDFWGRVMSNYEEMARKQPKLLTKKLQLGIPDSIRGTVWQFMCKGKSVDLENTYRALLTRSSNHEKIIQRDLARTFPSHDHFKDANGPGQESLFQVLKAYSIWDPEVGYCQGIAFITGPLLLNMPDEEAFCVLDKLMKAYNFRELYTPTMLGLKLLLFQYDRLLKEMFPAISAHFEAHDVHSSAYASQWFMTLFAYRFPIEIVFRIMDIIFAQGIEATFKFAFALLKRNYDTILATNDLADLLELLKNGLFEPYLADNNNVNALIQDAAAIRISKSRMDKLVAEHVAEIAKTNPELLTGDALKGETRRLAASLKKLEQQYEALNTEHINLAKRHIEIVEAKERAEQKVEENEIKLHGLKSVLSSERKVAEMEVQDEMVVLAKKNVELTLRNGDLQDMVDRLEGLLIDRESKINDLEELVKTLRVKQP
ncbi:GTPase-activating protein [Physocladia obscura]|uniref:GTPase-activating protein n=1 Tax=Physocladia obscura TaxID=109957 RepID=A0AAD5SSN9_9FUNG|nr:GTPase-activating protein [Physocladia obscura]